MSGRQLHMQGSVYDVLNNLTLHIEKQLKGADL